MIRVVCSSERYPTAHDGVESLHCFAAGAHYDPSNLGHGDLIGCDEHVVAPGGGFDWHAHRGVRIASWVMSGALRHQDDRGTDRVIEPGQLFEQDAADGIRHRETCASPAALRLVQLTALSGRFDVWRTGSRTDAGLWHLFVARGTWTIEESAVTEGDSVRGSGSCSIVGGGELLVWMA